MHSVISLLPNSLLPALEHLIGLNNILRPIVLGSHTDAATHSAGQIWHASCKSVTKLDTQLPPNLQPKR